MEQNNSYKNKFKTTITNFILDKNSQTFQDFYVLYSKQVKVWVENYIYDKSFSHFSDDITQDIFLMLWKNDKIFKNVQIHDDIEYFINSFNKYFRDIIIKRSVSSFFVKHRNYLESLKNRVEIDENISISGAKISEFSLEKLEEIIREKLLGEKEEKKNRKNFKRDVELYILVKIRDIPVKDVAKNTNLSPNAVSLAIGRLKKEIKALEDLLKDFKNK